MRRHPNKEIRVAIEQALNAGWQSVKVGKSSHAFCRLRCKAGHVEHQMSIWSTPKNPEIHARQILRKVKQCQLSILQFPKAGERSGL